MRSCGSMMRRANVLWTRQFGTGAATSPVGERGQRRQRAGRGLHERRLAGAIQRRRPGRVCAEIRCGGRRGLDASVRDREQRPRPSVSVGSDGSVLVAGHTDGTLPGQSSAGGYDAFVRKYDAAGAEVWTRQFGSANADYALSVSVGSDGSVLVAGSDGRHPSGAVQRRRTKRVCAEVRCGGR
jgi:hypothetical protein